MQLFIPLVMMQSFLPDLESSVGVLASMGESRDNPIPASEGGDGPRGRSPEESSAGVAALPYQLSDEAWRLLVLTPFYLRNVRGLELGPHTQGRRYKGWLAAAFSS